MSPIGADAVLSLCARVKQVAAGRLLKSGAAEKEKAAPDVKARDGYMKEM
jgi:hypothetical protein